LPFSTDTFAWRCGHIVPVFAAIQKAQIVTLTKPTDNPFNKSEILGVGEPRRIDKTGRRQRKRKFKQDLSYIKEEDFRTAVSKGAKLISYQETQ
jgi:hypothetical protein